MRKGRNNIIKYPFKQENLDLYVNSCVCGERESEEDTRTIYHRLNILYLIISQTAITCVEPPPLVTG